MAGRLQTIHHGHLYVHQNQVEVFGFNQVDGFTTMICYLHRQAFSFQQHARDFLVDFIVFHQQNSSASIDLRFRYIGVGGYCQLKFFAALQTSSKPEGAALAGATDNTGIASHQMGQMAVDGQTQAGAAILACSRGFSLHKRLEQCGLLLFTNTNTGILNFNF